MKTITTHIQNCDECPYCDHSGAFTPGGAKPICNHPKILETKGYDWDKRVIPYRREFIFNDERSILKPKRIPDWCPL